MSNPENTQEAMLGNDPATEQAAAAEAAPADNVDTIPSVEEQFKTLELKAAEHYDAWLRAKAEGENIAAAPRKTFPRPTSSLSRNSLANCWPSRTAWKPPWPCRSRLSRASSQVSN